MAKLSDDMWWHSVAVHESAHALIAWVLGFTVSDVTLAADRALLNGGGANVMGHGDAQHHTLVWLGTGYGQADWLTACGYVHPELRRCVLELGASGDRQIVDRYAADGFVLDRGQAASDSRRLLAEPHMKATLEALTDLLLSSRELAGDQVAGTALVHQAVRPPTPAVWIPGRRLRSFSLPPGRSEALCCPAPAFERMARTQQDNRIAPASAPVRTGSRGGYAFLQERTGSGAAASSPTPN